MQTLVEKKSACWETKVSASWPFAQQVRVYAVNEHSDLEM